MMNKIDLSRVDLNLLVLFDAVMQERHVGRAARKLHLSSSAVSHGLGRLRQLVKDPLFLRQPKGVVPTERANLLAAPVADILLRTRQVIAGAEEFEPKKCRRRFMLGAPDAASAVLLPRLLANIRRTAPGVDLGVRNLVGRFEMALDELDQRTLDVAVLPLEGLPARFVCRKLYDEDFVIVRRKGHQLGRNPSLAEYSAAPHLLVSVAGDPTGSVDQILAKQGLSRRVVLTVSNFMQALAVVAESDLVAALPRHFVVKHAARYGVVSVEPPMPLMSSPLSAIAPRVALADAGIAWLMDVLERTAKTVTGSHRSNYRIGK